MYRVAHKEDFFKGMYKSEYATDCLQPGSDRGHCHPMPYDDQTLEPYYEDIGLSRDHLYAFANDKQMNRWLTPRDLESLEAEGYVVWKIEPLDGAVKGEDYEIGETQMIFDSRKFKWEKAQ